MNSPIENKGLRTGISFLFVIYILILIKFILLKHPGNLKSHFIDNYNWQLLEKNFSQSNYIPLYTVQFYLTGTDKLRYTKENLVGNVFLFFPLGIFLPFLFFKVNNFQRIIILAFFISLFFELVQLFTILGNFDVDDIILNVLGTALGFGVFLLLSELISQKRVQSSE
ncbi:MAG: VanZ family protein [Chitinophagaceae bacterium]|nr:VanZ family protein [Chitinophagaceae bacterium]